MFARVLFHSRVASKVSSRLTYQLWITITETNQLLAFQLGALSNGSLSAVRSYCTLKVLWGHVELFIFHFSKNMFSFSKWVSEWAFIFKMWFFFKFCFSFQNNCLLALIFVALSTETNYQRVLPHALTTHQTLWANFQADNIKEWYLVVLIFREILKEKS